MPNPLIKAALIWLLLIPLAIGNGILRERVLTPALDSSLAQPLSGILLSMLIVLVTWFALPWFGALRARQYAAIGIEWLLLTLLFEFVFGRYVAGKSWHELMAAYDVTTGNLWLLVLVVIAGSPSAVARFKNAC
jgi:hypothetical protein